MIAKSTPKRIALFLCVCVPIRVLIVYGAYRLAPIYPLPVSAALALVAVGFGQTYVRSDPTKDLGFFGGPVWWHRMRLLHTLLYAIAAALAWERSPYTWVPLAIDILTGLVAVLRHYDLKLP